MNLIDAAKRLQEFQKGSLTNTIANLETLFRSSDLKGSRNKLSERKLDNDLLAAALLLKREAGQINVVIHAVGILIALPHILKSNETIEYISLGAGNTGRAFDLETNIRIAEFKFISWREKSNTIRQNSVFKDFFCLAEHETHKVRNLFVTGIDQPLKFLNGGRALDSIMDLNGKVGRDFKKKYGDRFKKVCDYYEYRKDLVMIMDLNDILPSFVISSVQASNVEE